MWKDLVNEFTHVARDRSEKFIPTIKVVPVHEILVKRVRYLKEWRKWHSQEQLKTRTTSACLRYCKAQGWAWQGAQCE